MYPERIKQKIISKEVMELMKLDRELLIKDKEHTKQKEGNNVFRIILDYNVQYKQMENKYWGIILKDNVLGPILPSNLLIIYNKAPNPQNFLAPVINSYKNSKSIPFSLRLL